ncbi:HipA family kinase [Caballeronia sp. LZ043]|uniref:HipA family kinase n=1 Tax=Caballeronia sp. LZ043 TaxID=3038569 RepID=UPI002862D03A|nr:HipA family kinase [Caballeronia sp. LZ043]MDR5824129.1 hypothetical protein [Caballeronia sp. LZ043]
MPVPLLDASAWCEFRGIPACDGANNTIHFATIRDASGQLRSCFVKLLKPNTPALLCEAVGWVLTASVGVPVPGFGAVVLVPVEQLRKNMALPNWTNGLNMCAAWCCEIVAGKSVKQVHKWAFWLSRKGCLRSQDVRFMAAFDVWTDNRDRNFGNLIRSSNGIYVAKDHETLLHDILWLSMGVSYTSRSLLDEAQQHLSSEELKAFHSAMAVSADTHQRALSSVQASLSTFINVLSPDAAPELAQGIMGYLTYRANPGWLAQKLGVIA